MKYVTYKTREFMCYERAMSPNGLFWHNFLPDQPLLAPVNPKRRKSSSRNMVIRERHARIIYNGVYSSGPITKATVYIIATIDVCNVAVNSPAMQCGFLSA